MSYSINSTLDDYATLRTVPAGLSAVFIVASLFQFGGVPTIDLTWLNYQLTAEHSVLISLGAFVVAFMSSETKRFESYEDTEKVLIALGPAVILGYQYVPEVSNILVDIGDPLGHQLAFVATVVSWGVAVR